RCLVGSEMCIRDRAGLKFYAGGVQGDELVVLRKIRAGQLQGGGFTGVGLGEIEPNLRVLEVPFTFRNEAEIAAVHRALDPTFEPMLREDGWEILGWADVGPVYLFTKQPVHQIDDLKKMRMWLWEGDPIAEKLLQTVGVSPVPLPITDVVTSLQTGLIDAVYNGPLACIALQWYTRISYMTDLPVTQASGAVVVSRKAFEQLSPAAQQTVHALANDAFARLREETARENAESIGVLKQKGIQIVSLEPGQAGSFNAIGKQVRDELAGKLYTREILDRALAAVEQYRASAGNPAGKP
ncbi:MAG: TRAP transporter substrate-binding protein DctP, partial [Candidatus Eisenbacteria bacterium]|nr:TRAP transporter substrate-binding protein DctP [Candidatus Eisenbacteria bacterium]